MEITVEAKQNSTTGGAGKAAGTYTYGSLVILTCNTDDTWKIGPQSGFTVNANGKTDQSHSEGNQTFAVGALVGSWDNGETYFAVGLLCQTTVLIPNNPSGQGVANLTLWCWDSDSANNSESITVTVRAANA